jgi:hypothetical protein
LDAVLTTIPIFNPVLSVEEAFELAAESDVAAFAFESVSVFVFVSVLLPQAASDIAIAAITIADKAFDTFFLILITLRFCFWFSLVLVFVFL